MRGGATNLVIIVSDELRYDALSCAGNRLARTPNLDRLAERGTRFANASAPSPICVPARASLATGLPVHRIGYWDNALAYDGRVPGWGHALQAAGVRVESIGKLHYRRAEDPTGFGAQHLALHIASGTGQVWGSVRDPLPAHRGRSPLFDELGPGESTYNRFDEAVAACACDWLAARGREARSASDGRGPPWVLFVGLVAPHFPLVVPQRWLDTLARGPIPLPGLLPRDGYAHHPWVARMVAFMDHDAAFADDAARRLAIACYHGLVAFLDAQVGRVLAAIDAAGLADRTRVLFTSDHGDNLGRRGLWNKCTLYRDASAVPMILAGPDVRAGHVCNTPVSLIDVHDTVLHSVGLERPAPPSGVERRSLLDVCAAADEPRRAVLSEYHAVGSPSAAFRLSDAGHAYHHYVGYRPELFDLVADPGETRDLAAQPRAPGVDALLAQWEARLAERLDPVAVDRAARRDQNALVAAVGGREAALAIGPPGASPAPDVPAPAVPPPPRPGATRASNGP